MKELKGILGIRTSLIIALQILSLHQIPHVTHKGSLSQN